MKLSHFCLYRQSSLLAILYLSAAASQAAELDEIVIWGQQQRNTADSALPNSILTQQDMLAINSTTTEDLVKYEPSLAIRRRFIGDANGTLGMRGANIFQTSRSMVFADGVPLHYLLQGRWNGAPRWTMVSASEIAQVEVLYGPFSAEYSGNAMGGVVLIESAIPQQQEFHFDSSWFSQDFSAYGFDESISGYKTFVSWGDRIADTSLFLSWNRLESQSQPQMFYFGGNSAARSPVPVNGAIAGNDDQSVSRFWFGDSGIVDSTTDNYKIKVGHSFGEWELLLNVAYEDRLSDSSSPNSYLYDINGNPVWQGDVVQAGEVFSVPAARLGVNKQQRDSLSAGLRLRGSLSDKVSLEANLNHFAVLQDESRSSLVNPQDRHFDGRGEIVDFGDTGWSGAEIKLRIDDFLSEQIELVTGLRHDTYEMNLDVLATDDYKHGEPVEFINRSGGQTTLDAAFFQALWTFAEDWEMGLGLRWERFRSHDGYFSAAAATAALDLVAVPTSHDTVLSPKFSLRWNFLPDWNLAYAFGEAYRFPIVEELFSQYAAYNAVNVANPALRPEHGRHHNLMLEHELENGVLRANLFFERVHDTIEPQSEQLPGGLSVRTFVPMDLTQTQGVELIAQLQGVWLDALDIRTNLVWTDAKILRNAADPALAGNRFPRMPEWRANLLATYHVSEAWNIGLSLQYASDSFGRNDNHDRERQVYGAQDAFAFVGMKSTWHLGKGVSLSVGVDNLNNELAFVAHPWPGRTWYGSFAYAL